MLFYNINKTAFKSWLKENHDLAEITYSTIVSDAFLIYRESIGVTIEDLFYGRKSYNDYKDSVERWLINNGKKVGTRHIGYTSHVKYLVDYLRFYVKNSSCEPHANSKTDLCKDSNLRVNYREIKLTNNSFLVKTIDKPSPIIVESYIKSWENLEKYVSQEEAIKCLFIEK